MSVFRLSVGSRLKEVDAFFQTVEDMKIDGSSDIYLVLSSTDNIQESVASCCRLYAMGHNSILAFIDVARSKIKPEVLGLPCMHQKDDCTKMLTNRSDLLIRVYGPEIAAVLIESKSFEDAKKEIERSFEMPWNIVLSSAEIEFSAKWMEEFNMSKLDSFLISKITAVPLFLIIMYAVFLFSVNIGRFFQKELMELLSALIQFAYPSYKFPIILYVYKVIAHGVETVLSFVPLLMCMYSALSFLERSGYMKRAVRMVDIFSSRIRVPGAAFASLITGFGCNVQSIMATSSLNNKEDKIITIMMAPFIACGARLSVFVLFSSVFFADYGYNIVFALYIVGILVAIGTAIIFRPSHYSKCEYAALPKLLFPNLICVLKDAVNKTMEFISGAGKMIFLLFVCIYVINTYPIDKPSNFGERGNLIEFSKRITPIFKPIGINEDNWPAVAAIATGVVAKESIVGTMNAIYGEDEAGYVKMRSAFNGKLGAFCYLLFILLYFPCISVFVAISKQLNYGWALISLLWSNFMAYTISAFTYQVGMIYLEKPENIYYLLVIVLIALYMGKFFIKYKQRTNVISKT